MRLLLKGSARGKCKVTWQGGAQKGKDSQGSETIDVRYDLRRTSNEKVKIRNGENLDSSCSVAQAEKKVRMVRIIESISKNVNSAKHSIVMASSTETSIADENETSLYMILSEISKLNSKVKKLLKQANDFSKSD